MVSLDALKSAFDESKRPVFLVGNGLRLSHGGKGIKLIADFCEKNSIPIVSTYLAADFYPDSFPNYLGVTGLKAARRSKYCYLQFRFSCCPRQSIIHLCYWV